MSSLEATVEIVKAMFVQPAGGQSNAGGHAYYLLINEEDRKRFLDGVEALYHKIDGLRPEEDP